MKRICLVAVMLLLTACGKSTNGTYFPSDMEMRENLENAGYLVEISENLEDDFRGKALSASKGNEYLMFFWFEDATPVSYYETKLESEYPEYNKLISMENDEKFGSFVFCCSSQKISDDAGISIVEVKVNVK